MVVVFYLYSKRKSQLLENIDVLLHSGELSDIDSIFQEYRRAEEEKIMEENKGAETNGPHSKRG